MTTTHLLYLHGFRSSPRSVKAKKTAVQVQRCHPQVHWWCPQLPPSPKAAMQLVSEGLAAWQREPGFERLAVVGSSLGGFYATWVAEHTGCKAVLLNPAIHPARDLSRYVGEQTTWHDPAEKFVFRPEFIEELQRFEAGPLQNPQNYLAVIAKGDEVLDWREMTSRYTGAKIKLLEGGDHALSDFASHLGEILAFLDLPKTI